MHSASLNSRYNSAEHPIPFHKAADFGSKPSKKIAKGEAPDQEDVYDNEDDEVPPDDEPAGGSDSDNDVSKDKLIKNKAKPKATKVPAKPRASTSAAASGKGTAKASGKGKK